MSHLIIVIVKTVAPPVPVATSQILCVSVVLTGVENMAAASEEDAAPEPPTPSPTPPLDNEL